MGLDLTVNINKKIKTKIKDEELDISSDNSSLYYRLNWSAVNYEIKYFHSLLSFENLTPSEKLKIKTSKSKINKKNIYLVEYEYSDFFGDKIPIKELVYGKDIKRTKNNTIKVKNKKISKYKIYNVTNIKHYPSILSVLSLYSWNGSNGEEFIITTNKIGEMVLSSVHSNYSKSGEYIDNNYEEIIKIKDDELINFKNILLEIKNILENLLKSDDEYINNKSLIIIDMLLTKIEDEESEMYICFG